MKNSKRLVVDVTPDLHSQVKTRAVAAKTTVRNLVLSALEKAGAIRHPEKRPAQ